MLSHYRDPDTSLAERPRHRPWTALLRRLSPARWARRALNWYLYLTGGFVIDVTHDATTSVVGWRWHYGKSREVRVPNADLPRFRAWLDDQAADPRGDAICVADGRHIAIEACVVRPLARAVAAHAEAVQNALRL